MNYFLAFLPLAIVACVNPAFAQEAVSDLSVFGDIDMRIIAILAVLAGFLRQVNVPIGVSIGAPAVIGIGLGALGAQIAGMNLYEVAVSGLSTAAAAVLSGRLAVVALEPRKPE